MNNTLLALALNGGQGGSADAHAYGGYARARARGGQGGSIRGVYRSRRERRAYRAAVRYRCRVNYRRIPSSLGGGIMPAPFMTTRNLTMMGPMMGGGGGRGGGFGGGFVTTRHLTIAGSF